MKKNLLFFFFPGYLLWKQGQKYSGGGFGFLAFFFLSLAILGPCLISFPEKRYLLFWEFLAQAPTRADLFRILGFGLYGFSCFAALLHAHFHPPKAYVSGENDKSLWKEILELWLQNREAEALKKCQAALEQGSRDPFLSYLTARLFFDEKNLIQASHFLAKTQLFDCNNELRFERERLAEKIQGEQHEFT
jgi:hypothetical protein